METQVLKKDDLAASGSIDSVLYSLANTVIGEGDALAKKLLEFGNNGLEAVFVLLLSIGTTQMAHQNDGLGAILNGILDGGESTDDTLVVGDVLFLVKRNIEVDLEAQH